jgi:hypothetical protein
MTVAPTRIIKVAAEPPRLVVVAAEARIAQSAPERRVVTPAPELRVARVARENRVVTVTGAWHSGYHGEPVMIAGAPPRRRASDPLDVSDENSATVCSIASHRCGRSQRQAKRPNASTRQQQPPQSRSRSHASRPSCAPAPRRLASGCTSSRSAPANPSVLVGSALPVSARPVGHTALVDARVPFARRIRDLRPWA